MRNLGAIIILALIGMAAWRASDRYRPVRVPETIKSKVDQAILHGARLPLPVEKVADSLQVDTVLVKQVPSTQKETTIIKPSPEMKASITERQESEPASLDFDRVVIPSLKVNANVISKSYSQLTWDLSDLEQDVAVLEDIPDQQPENNILLAGHITVYNGSNGPFRYISKLEPGQQVILYNDQFKYTYTVRDQVLVYPDDTYVLQDTSKPQLTLITCATWDEETLSYLRRRVIFADLEQVELNSNNKKYQ